MAAHPEIVLSKARKETQSTPLAFPRDGSINNQQTMISLFKYNRLNPRELPEKLKTRDIFLPLPMAGIEDNIALQYQDVPLGAVGGLLAPAKGAAGEIAKAAGAAMAGAQFLATSALGAAGDVLNEAGAAAAAKAGSGASAMFARISQGVQKFGGQAQEATAQALGMADNPNMSLSFQGVELRNHNFTWRLIAKSMAESVEIESIINYLKINALPQKVFGAGFHLGYPSIALISFYPTNLIKISDLGCFITAINVKYDGDGHPVFFKGEKPVIVDLSISFRERAILTSDDYWDYHSDAINPLGNDKVPGNFIGGAIGGTPV